ncbi:MAG: hypothetical protein ACI9G1_002648, partial [Pirellulaceae bacterium]
MMLPSAAPKSDFTMEKTMTQRSIFAALLVCMSYASLLADETDIAENRELESSYGERVQPLLKTYCFECHSGDTTEAEIDLALFTSAAKVRSDLKTWQKMRHILDTNQMPPKEAKQPSDADKEILRTWVRKFLAHEARAQAGDPGPVVLRRLNNSEYTYALQDLTGVSSLDPAKEFPVDGAAGEGFINSGAAQAMSPSLFTKYLDAAKAVSQHAVLLPDGIRFSQYTTRQDKTIEILGRIQAFYRRYSDDGDGAMVNLQGIKFSTNKGGLLAPEKYLAAVVEEREALLKDKTSIEAIAKTRNLNARYLRTLFERLSDSDDEPSFLLDVIRAKWRTAKPADVAALAQEVTASQKALWKFNPVGQIGRAGGPKSWLEPVSPIATRRELRLKLPSNNDNSDIVFYLGASDLGDGNENDFVSYQQPRIEFDPATKIPPVMLRDVNTLTSQFEATVTSELKKTASYLAAVRKLGANPTVTVEQIAKEEKLDHDLLESWISLVDLGTRADRKIRGLYTTKLANVQGHKTINGWGTHQTPILLTNTSKDPISFSTLTVPARGVTVHPSPTLEAIVSWRSPISGKVQIKGLVADADIKCGNGAEWRLQLVNQFGASNIATGVIDNGARQEFKSDAMHDVRQGDVISLIIGPRDASHACDTTHIELSITGSGEPKKVWNLASDIVDKVLQGNPLPDSYGNNETWHFSALQANPQKTSPVPNDTTLAQWRTAVSAKKPAAEIQVLEQAIQNSLSDNDATISEPDRKFREHLSDWRGPLEWLKLLRKRATPTTKKYGLVNAEFGRHPNGSAINETDCCAQAPHALEIRLPAKLFAGAEFVTTGVLLAPPGKQATVQLQVSTSKPTPESTDLNAPILVSADPASLRNIEAAVKDYRDLFPAALCYYRIVPVDEVVTLQIFYREDDQLKRLMLDENQRTQLDKLWDELYYVSLEPIKLTVTFEQLAEFATQDRPDLVKAFIPLKKPINDRADVFRQHLIDSEPQHLTALIRFAAKSWRRKLTANEHEKIESLYRGLRATEIPHDEAIRLTLARILTSPAFLYRLEKPAAGKKAAPVTNVELANRLSFFLWSSLPDRQLMDVAVAGELATDDMLREQTMRMLAHPHSRRLAIQFACQWLHIRDFDQNDDKNEKLYPQFASLKADMYEETVRFFEDMFLNDRSVL